MSQDHRMIAPDGSRIPFSCENRRFSTNLSKPYSHGAFASTPGSVLKTELINHGDASLWLEHVSAKDSGEELYWLMWYDKNGMPTIPLSGVFSKSDLQNMVGRLAGFTP